MNDSCKRPSQYESKGDMLSLELPTFLCTFNFRKISVASSRCWLSKILQLRMLVSARSNQPEHWTKGVDSLLCVEGDERQIQ